MKLTDHQASSLRQIATLPEGYPLDSLYIGRVAAALRRLELVTIEERDGERLALATATGRAWIEADDTARETAANAPPAPEPPPPPNPRQLSLLGEVSP